MQIQPTQKAARLICDVSRVGENGKMRKDKRWKFFKCQQCGKCCAEIGLPYDPESIFKIAEYLDLTIEQIIDKYYGRMDDDGKTWISDDSKRTPCPFLETNGDMKLCSIYEVRPSGCRAYPLDC